MLDADRRPVLLPPQWSRPYRRRIRGAEPNHYVGAIPAAMEPPLQKAD